MKQFLLALGFLLQLTAFSQQALLSPEKFLGYSPGSRYTNHYQIVQYFQSLAEAQPGKVKLVNYGKTYEGRPLMLAFISSEENSRFTLVACQRPIIPLGVGTRSVLRVLAISLLLMQSDE